MTRQYRHATVLALALFVRAGIAAAQPPQAPNLKSPVATVRDAPFSADAEVLMKLVTFDGVRLDQTLRSKYYRDSAGRVRREQTIAGLTGLNPVSDTQSIVTIVDPVAGFIYTIVGGRKEVQRMRIDAAESRADKDLLSGRYYWQSTTPGAPALPGIGTDEVLIGTRQIDGLAAVGSRTTTTIAAGVAGNEKPMEVVEERWEATELKVLLLSRQHNPRSGDVEYRLVNINRREPAKSLFEVPAGYRVVDIPPRLTAR